MSAAGNFFALSTPRMFFEKRDFLGLRYHIRPNTTVNAGDNANAALREHPAMGIIVRAVSWGRVTGVVCSLPTIATEIDLSQVWRASHRTTGAPII